MKKISRYKDKKLLSFNNKRTREPWQRFKRLDVLPSFTHLYGQHLLKARIIEMRAGKEAGCNMNVKVELY